MKKSKIQYLIKILFFIILCQTAGIIGSIFTTPNIQPWYSNLNKPFFNPPNWIFGPVWIILYTLMGISLYLISKKIKKNKNAESAIIIFVIHLVFNSAWSIVFFGLQNLFGGLVVIIILNIFIFYLIYIFYKINRTASFLLIPYLLWVMFATLLNISIYILNK
ncbi:tryptophan-rich sensory protein [Candidatus Dojkabacteria bacterium]|nr:tryptophan-rich sensory protein [Candidatus Dojkabacteria bacterium]